MNKCAAHSCCGVDLDIHSLAGDLFVDANYRAPVLPRNLCTFRDQLIALFVSTNIRAALKSHFDVIGAQNAAAARTALASGQIDLLLMDVGLPDTDGIQLTALDDPFCWFSRDHFCGFPDDP